MNFEIKTVLKCKDIVKITKIQKPCCFDHIRMGDNKEVKKIKCCDQLPAEKEGVRKADGSSQLKH